MTKWWDVRNEPVDASHPSIIEAAKLLQSGDTVAFPTETVYGLGGDARNDTAVARIFAAKGRPQDNPLIVHIGDQRQLDQLVVACDEVSTRLMDVFWPGPLTIILPVQPYAISPLATAGLPTVAIRMPDHPIALALLQAAQCPVVAPSANLSGRPSPTCAEHVLNDLQGKIGGIVDGGPAKVGIESTVVEVVERVVHILRPGAVTAEQIEAALRVTTTDLNYNVSVRELAENGLEVEGLRIYRKQIDQTDFVPKSPGMKYTHYAPSGTMTIVRSDSPDRAADWIREQLRLAEERGERTGVLTFNEHETWYEADHVLPCGSINDVTSIAQRLYDTLRQFDDAEVTCIFTDCWLSGGLGGAVMNRLQKAAGYRIAHV